MVGLIFDASDHYLDHLAPLCELWDIPLTVFDPQIADLAKRYYPDLKLRLEEAHTFLPPKILLSCAPRPLLQASLFHPINQTIWLPHGQSDKPPCFEVLQEESAALVYGPQMHQWIQKAVPELNILQIGNFRYRYFLKHKQFYSKFLPTSHKTTFLYAPTWDDYEQSNTFWNSFPTLARTLCDSDGLWVKLHPNTYRQFPEKVERMKGQFAKPNIHWIEDFPPIYPILQAVDAYIGDVSSIGYDFLTLDKPLFFLNEKQTLLSQSGVHVKPENVFESYRALDLKNAKRKVLCEKTFCPNPHLEEVKQKLFADR